MQTQMKILCQHVYAYMYTTFTYTDAYKHVFYVSPLMETGMVFSQDLQWADNCKFSMLKAWN